MPTSPGNVSLSDAAGMMKCNEKLVSRLLRDCVIPGAKIGRAWVIKHDDVQNHIDREIVRQTSSRMGRPRNG